MNIGKGRLGFWLMVCGIAVLAAQATFRLVRLFNDAEGISNVFWFVLGSSIFTLLVSSIIVYFMVKSPRKVSLFSVLWFSVAVLFGLASIFANHGQTELIIGFVGYGLLLSGSLIIYRDSRNLIVS